MSDAVAARVLLQVLRPGLRSLGRRLALGGSFDDVDQELLAITWERIRTYPFDRRPSSIAAYILLDARKMYVRSVAGPETRLLSLDDRPASRASAEHEALDAHGPSLRRAHARLTAAIDRGAITPASAFVVWRTRVQEDDEGDVAADLGVGVRTLQRRRQRAERELAKAVPHPRLTTREVGAELGMSHNRVIRELDLAGIPRRSRRSTAP